MKGTLKFLIMEFSPATCYLLQSYVLPFMWETEFYSHTKQEVKLYYSISVLDFR
jgi:hypothetical protein